MLPGLGTLGRASVDLGVQVGLGDPIEQLLETERAGGRRLDEQPALDQAHLDGRVVREADLFCERLRDPDSQAVTPPLYLGLHGDLLWAVSTMSIPHQARLQPAK